VLLGRYTLRSPAPPEEVLRRLERLLAPVPPAAVSDAGAGGPGRVFRGRAEDGRFTMRRVLASGRSSFIRVRGQVAPDPRGTAVQVALGFAGVTPWLFVGVLAACGWVVARALVAALRGGAVRGPALSWMLLYPVAVGLALLVLAAERGRVRRLLGYLTGELTARGLSHDVAEARD
jgi:hypothetical protein